MKVQIPASALRASAFCMAQRDVRYYLNGTLLDVTGPTEGYVVSTDGHVLFAGRVTLEYLEGEQAAAWSIIIPSEVILKLDKKAPWFVLEALGDGRYMLDGKVFTPTDGKFPDYWRVIPQKVSGEPALLDPLLVSRCVKAITTYHKVKESSTAWCLNQGGSTSSSVVFGSTPNAVCVVMPMDTRKRDEPEYRGFMTPTQEFKKVS